MDDYQHLRESSDTEFPVGSIERIAADGLAANRDRWIEAINGGRALFHGSTAKLPEPAPRIYFESPFYRPEKF